MPQCNFLANEAACFCKSSTIFSSWATDRLLKNVVTLAALILLVSYSPTLVHTDEFWELESVWGYWGRKSGWWKEPTHKLKQKRLSGPLWGKKKKKNLLHNIICLCNIWESTASFPTLHSCSLCLSLLWEMTSSAHVIHATSHIHKQMNDRTALGGRQRQMYTDADKLFHSHTPAKQKRWKV